MFFIRAHEKGEVIVWHNGIKHNVATSAVCQGTAPLPNPPLPIPCAKPKCLTQPTSGWISSAAEIGKTQTVQSLRSEFWTFTKSLNWTSLLHQADYFSAIDLMHETISKSTDTWNQTHLSSTVKLNINFHGSKSFEHSHSDVSNMSTLSCKITFWRLQTPLYC